MTFLVFFSRSVYREASLLLRQSYKFNWRELCSSYDGANSFLCSRFEGRAIDHALTIPFRSSGLRVPIRNYAKGKDKKKEKGKQKVVVDERQLAEFVPLDHVKEQMQHAVDRLKTEYIQALSLRSSRGAIENLKVNFEGKDHTIQELGQVIHKDQKTVIINLSSFPQVIPAVLKTLQNSGMNLNAQQDGTTLFIPIPRVTTEHREKLAKNAKALFLKCRDSVKDIQNKQVKEIKNREKIAKDDASNVQTQLTALADSYVANADTLLQTKLKELVGKE